jgi:hypothetical protein
VLSARRLSQTLNLTMFNIFKRKKATESIPRAAEVGSPDVQIVCGVDTYHFPTDIIGQPHLQWMGSNYVETIVNKVSAGLIKQEPGTQVIAIQCLRAPELSTRVNGRDDSIVEMTVKIPIQVRLRNSQSAHWRLNGQAIFQQPFNNDETNLGRFTFDIQQAEEVR